MDTFRYRVQATSCAGDSAWSPDIVVLPVAPSGLSVTHIGTLVILRWTDNSDFESYFEVQREHRIGTTWGQTRIVATPPANSTSATDSTGAGTWQYRLHAANIGGTSAWTAWVMVTI